MHSPATRSEPSRATDITARPVTREELAGHRRVASRFVVDRVCRVSDDANGLRLVEHALAAPFAKDYDQLEDPLAWPERFDTRRWVLLVAHRGGERAGGAVVAVDTPGVDLLEARNDLAVLWDLRVDGRWRRQGIGLALLDAAQAWALAHGCGELKVETQDVNAAACRLYRRFGFRLASATPGIYVDVPDETRLIWRKAIRG